MQPVRCGEMRRILTIENSFTRGLLKLCESAIYIQSVVVVAGLPLHIVSHQDRYTNATYNAQACATMFYLETSHYLILWSLLRLC